MSSINVVDEHQPGISFPSWTGEEIKVIRHQMVHSIYSDDKEANFVLFIEPSNHSYNK